MNKRRSFQHGERPYVGTRQYPADSHGIPIPVEEIGLPPSQLDTDNRYNLSLHHRAWTYSMMSRTLITKAFADLERMHVLMPNDQHNLGRTALHALYGPPRPPTILQAFDVVNEAYELNENLEIRRSGKGYVRSAISDSHMAAMKQEYNNLRGQ